MRLIYLNKTQIFIQARAACKRMLVSIVAGIVCNSLCAQPITDYNEYRSLDSIANTNGPAKHFASLFLHTLQEIEKQLQENDPAARSFTRRFELAFIHYFTDECSRYTRGDSVGNIWRTYFCGAEKSILEYQLTGVNAHINGDIWKALVNNFTREEIEANATCFIAYQRSLENVFNSYFDDAKHRNTKLRLYNTVTLGLDRSVGRWLLHKWRKRQEKLALLYFADRKKFEKKLKQLDKRRERINKKILLLF